MIDCGKEIELNSKEIQQFIDLLQIPEKKRSDNVLDDLTQLFSKLSFFKEFMEHKETLEEIPSILNKCAKNAYMEKYPENICIQQSGTTLKRMQFLLRGKVGVYVNLKEEFISKEEIQQRQQLKEQLDPNLLNLNVKNDEQNIKEGEQVELKSLKNLVLIESYLPGYHFGNIDLLYEKKSNIYLIATENCEFACLDKKYYNSFIKKFDENRTHVLMEEISYSFPHWSKNRIKNYFIYFLVLKFKKGETVYSEKQPPLGCYLVKDGNFTTYQLIQLSEIDKKSEETTHFKNNPSSSQAKILDETTKTQKSKSKKSKQLHTSLRKQIQLFCLVKGQMFGEEEILQYRNRNFSVKCDSIDGTLYFLRKADFLQIVQDDPEQKYEFLSLAFHKKQLHKMRKIQIKEKISQYKSYIYEDRMKIEQENKSLIYLDSNNKPKSKLDLNEYLNNNKQKDPTIRSDFSPNRNSVTRIPSPNVQQNKRSFSLSSLHFKNLIQKQMAFQTPTKINQEEVVGREQQMPNSQKQINSNNNISIESERMMTQLEKFPSRLLSLQTLNSPRSVDQYQQSSFALVNTPRKKKSSEISKLNFNLPILNLDKIAQQNFIEYSPRRYLNKNLRNTNRQKKSQSQHIQDDNVDQYIFLDSSSNFCTHRSEIKPKIINIQSTGIDEEALKKSKNVSQQVDNLILSQKYKNYQQTLDFFKNYQPINPRKMYKDIINEHSFNNLYQIKLAEKNKLYDKKEKTFNFIQLQQGLKSIQDITKKRSLQSLISQNQIPSSSTLIQIQSLIKLDEDLPDQINSKNANVPQKITLPIQLEGTFNYKKFDLKEQIQLNQQKTENQLPNELNHTNSNQISIKKLATPKQIISIKNLASNLNNFSKLDKNSIQQKDSVQLRKNSLSKLNKILQSKY